MNNNQILLTQMDHDCNLLDPIPCKFEYDYQLLAKQHIKTKQELDRAHKISKRKNIQRRTDLPAITNNRLTVETNKARHCRSNRHIEMKRSIPIQKNQDLSNNLEGQESVANIFVESASQLGRFSKDLDSSVRQKRESMGSTSMHIKSFNEAGIKENEQVEINVSSTLRVKLRDIKVTDVGHQKMNSLASKLSSDLVSIGGSRQLLAKQFSGYSSNSSARPSPDFKKESKNSKKGILKYSYDSLSNSNSSQHSYKSSTSNKQVRFNLEKDRIRNMMIQRDEWK